MRGAGVRIFYPEPEPDPEPGYSSGTGVVHFVLRHGFGAEKAVITKVGVARHFAFRRSQGQNWKLSRSIFSVFRTPEKILEKRNVRRAKTGLCYLSGGVFKGSKKKQLDGPGVCSRHRELFQLPFTYWKSPPQTLTDTDRS